MYMLVRVTTSSLVAIPLALYSDDVFFVFLMDFKYILSNISIAIHTFFFSISIKYHFSFH